MKIHYRFFRLAIAAFMLTIVFVQAQSPSAQTTRLNQVAQKVQRYVNLNQIDSLYALTNEAYQKEILVDRLKKVTSELRHEGRWKSMKFEKMSNGVASYTATFEKSLVNFTLALDKDGRIAGMGFRPN